MKSTKSLFLVVALLLTTLVAGAGNAFANTAANTQIVNTAKLTYNGGLTAGASVTVAVALVPSSPNVSITYGNAAYTAPNTPAITDSVTITATANGPATYNIAAAIASSNNVLSSNPAVATPTTPSVTIGATVTTGTSTSTSVTVPAGLASGSGSAVNGIGVNSTIFFTVNGNSYTRQVATTTDNGNGTFTLSWSTPLNNGDAAPAGVLIAEQKVVSISVTPGTVQTAGSPITVGVTAKITTSGASEVDATTAQANNWTTPAPNVNLTKYVRNLTTNAAGTAGAISITVNTITSTYYTAGVTGKPTDTLEYVLVASNTGATDLTTSSLSDLIPTAYLNFATGVYGGKDVFYIDPTGATYTFTAAAVGANQASYVAANNPNLIVNVGTGASPSLAGTIPAGKSVTIAYQAVIK